MKTYLRVLGIGLAVMLFQVPTANAAPAAIKVWIPNAKRLCRAQTVYATRFDYVVPALTALGVKKGAIDALRAEAQKAKADACLPFPKANVLADALIERGTLWKTAANNVKTHFGATYSEADDLIDVTIKYNVERSSPAQGFARTKASGGAWTAS